MAEILILPIWLILWALLCGVGLLAARIFGLKPSGADDYLNCFWVGWSFLLFILQLWQFFLPVNMFIAAAVILAGLFGLFCGRRGIIAALTRATRCHGILFFLVLLMLFPVANGALLPSHSYDDAGLYGLQTMRWFNQYSVVPGLANLHGRLAFNSSYFLYAAFLNTIHENFYRLANGLLYLGFLLQAGFGILCILRAGKVVRFAWVFQALLICPLLILDRGIDFSLLSSDISVYFVGMLAAIQLLGLLEDRGLDGGLGDRRRLFYIFSLCLAGITLKLSFLAVGASTIVIAALSAKPGERVPARCWALTVVVILSWIARSVIMSGYPFYPLALFPFSVEWRVPSASVKAQMSSIVSFARIPGILYRAPALNGYGWLKSWWARHLAFSWITMILPLWLAASGLLAAFFARRAGAKPVLDRKVYFFLLPSAIGLVYWFFSAPEIRFCGATFFVIGMGALAAGGYELMRGKKIFGMNIIIAAYLFFCLTIFYSLPIFKKGAGSIGFYEEPRAAVFDFVTASGLKVYIPLKDNRCFDHEIPCTPYFHDGLSLRSANILRDGFKITPYDDNDNTVGVPREGIRR